MKKYSYYEYDPLLGDITVTFSDEYIRKYYYPYWSKKMKEAGKEDQISYEKCLEDWIVVHWAWEVKDE